MFPLLIVTLLALLWMLTLTNVGGADFLRVEVTRFGRSIIHAQDILVGLGIICLMISLRGPLAFTAAGLFVVWLLALFGIPQLFGVEVSPVVVIMIVVGVCVALVTQQDR
jgi:hypothetical protein